MIPFCCALTHGERRRTYTGKALILLTANTAKDASLLNMPESSELSLHITSDFGEETMSFTDVAVATSDVTTSKKADATEAKPVSTMMTATARQFTDKLTAEGRMMLKPGNEELYIWAFSVIPDNPLVIRFVGEPKRAVNGTLEISYDIEDNHGAAAL